MPVLCHADPSGISLGGAPVVTAPREFRLRLRPPPPRSATTRAAAHCTLRGVRLLAGGEGVPLVVRDMAMKAVKQAPGAGAEVAQGSVVRDAALALAPVEGVSAGRLGQRTESGLVEGVAQLGVVYAGTLWGALQALHSGVTMIAGWAHNVRSPEHTDVNVRALRDSGVRAVFLHGGPGTDTSSGV